MLGMAGSSVHTLIKNGCYAVINGIIVYGNITHYSEFYATDIFGNSHSFVISIYSPCVVAPGGTPVTGSAYATDGSGYFLSVTMTPGNGSYTSSSTMYDPSGRSVTSYGVYESGGGVIEMDPDGNSQSYSATVPTTTYTDSLGLTSMTATYTTSTDTYGLTWSNATGQSQASITFSPLAIGYGTPSEPCGQVNNQYDSIYNLITGMTFADSTSLSIGYELATGNNTTGGPCYSGRFSSLTLPTGGVIAYTYSGADNIDGTPSTMTRTDPSGTWTYLHTWISNTSSTTAVTDPAGNETDYTFTGYVGGTYETLRKVYAGPASGTPLETVQTCYNNNCTSIPTLPFTQIDVYTSLNGSANKRLTTAFDSYGNVTSVIAYDFGASTPTTQAFTFYGQSWNGTSCTAYPAGVYISNTPCYSHTENSAGVDVAKTQITYSNTGHPTSVSEWKSGSLWLTSTATYNSNGTLATSTDVNGAVSMPAYGGTGGCNDLLPTSITAASLTTLLQWNCTGGVVTSTTDANNAQTVYTHNDPLWRLTAMTDPLNNTTNYSYSSTAFESTMNFNGAVSTADALSTSDGLGRKIFEQKKQVQCQGPSCNFDSVQTVYGWTSATGACVTQPPYTGGACVTQSMPYSGTAAQPAPAGTKITTTQYDALGRPIAITDGGGGTTSYTYVKNDVLQVVGPTQNFVKQFEYDGLGRLTSVCEVTAGTTAWPGGNCAQVNPQIGYWTKYTYDALGNLLTVTQNAQGTPQTRTYAYDGLSRLVSESNPETGTTAYTYGSDLTCGVSDGDLVKRVDAANNVTCYTYDALHRVTTITYPSGPYAASTPSKTFVYDATTFGCTNSNAYVKGRLAEAFTGPSSAKITDIAYCYSARGETTDEFESTPDSNGYYHTTASYWANGALSALSGVPSHGGWTFGVDGEGRPNSALDGTTNLVPANGVTYNTASQPTGVALGSGDSDTYTYDLNTGRLKTYGYDIGSTPKYVTGTLNWNANWSLGSLVIADGFNKTDSQNCGYSYDGLARLASVNCGPTNPDGTTWGQTFAYDPFGNINKSGTSSFLPTYTGNQYNQIPGGPAGASHYYDLNGNLTSDLTNSYAWDADSNTVGFNLGGSAPISITYDAFGRAVERNNSGTYQEILYSPVGRLALMAKQNTNSVFLPLPGGEQATYTGSTIRFRHYDWQGSARFESSMAEKEYGDIAYAPFGEMYASQDTIYASFTGQQQDTISGMYDFLYREYSPVQGRWISPDPSGMGAASPTNPQTWNRYAYVLNDPLANMDPLGLDCIHYHGGAGSNFYQAGYCGDTLYYVDGVPTSAGLAQNLLSMGSAAQCPNNDCFGIRLVDGPVGPAGRVLLQRWVPAGLTTPAPTIVDGVYTWQSGNGNWQTIGTISSAANTDSPAWAFTKTLFSLQPQVDAWNKGYYKCLAKTAAGGATAPVVTHAAGVAATNAVENGASTIAGAYYHFTDARFTAWGKYSQVLVPNLAPKIAAVAEALDVAGWAYFDYELGKAIGECSGVLQ